MAQSGFKITRWGARSYHGEAAGPDLAHVAAGRTFSGEWRYVDDRRHCGAKPCQRWMAARS